LNISSARRLSKPDVMSQRAGAGAAPMITVFSWPVAAEIGNANHPVVTIQDALASLQNRIKK
jgi:hypothetical protein